MKYQFILWFICLSICSGCKKNNGLIQEIETISIGPGEDSTIQAVQFFRNIKIKNIDNQIIAYWINYKSNSFYIHNLTTSQKNNFTPDSSIVRVIHQDIDYQLLSINEIGFYSSIDKQLFILNVNGEIIREIDINESLSENDQNISPCSFQLVPFIYSENRMIFPVAYTDLIINDTGSLKNYCKRDIAICFITDKQKCSYFTYGQFPANYKTGNMYDQLIFNFCLNNRHELIYSFAASDSVFVYSSEDGKFLQQHEAKSRFSKAFSAYDLSKLTDLNYYRQFHLCNDFYGKIVYDQFRDLYYRVYKKEVSYLNDKGKIRSGNEIPWTLIILDKYFIKIAEIEFDPSLYSSVHIIPAEQGVYISHPFDYEQPDFSLKLSLLKFVL